MKGERKRTKPKTGGSYNKYSKIIAQQGGNK